MAVAALAGGSLFTSCTGRVWESVIDGTRTFTLSLLNPQTLVDSLVGTAETAAESP